MINQFKSGTMCFNAWAALGGSSAFGYMLGQRAGPMGFGDSQRVHNHWSSYMFVKSQNRFTGRNILSKKPTY